MKKTREQIIKQAMNSLANRQYDLSCIALNHAENGLKSHGPESLYPFWKSPIVNEYAKFYDQLKCEKEPQAIWYSDESDGRSFISGREHRLTMLAFFLEATRKPKRGNHGIRKRRNTFRKRK